MTIASLWRIFAIPGDRCRSGRAVVSVLGWLGLVLELVILYGAVWALLVINPGPLALILGVVVTLY